MSLPRMNAFIIDVNNNRHFISLQYPYTLDSKLITSFDKDYTYTAIDNRLCPMRNNVIVINGNVAFDEDKFKESIRQAIINNSLLSEIYYYSHLFDDIFVFNINDYIKKINRQVTLDKQVLYELLVIQGRRFIYGGTLFPDYVDSTSDGNIMEVEFKTYNNDNFARHRYTGATTIMDSYVRFIRDRKKCLYTGALYALYDNRDLIKYLFRIFHRYKLLHIVPYCTITYMYDGDVFCIDVDYTGNRIYYNIETNLRKVMEVIEEELSIRRDNFSDVIHYYSASHANRTSNANLLERLAIMRNSISNINSEHNIRVFNNNYIETSDPVINVDINTMESNIAECKKTDSITSVLHPYNYIPVYNKHFCDDENKDEHTTLLLGAEIEVAGCDTVQTEEFRNKVMTACLHRMNGNDSIEEKYIYNTYDSTVQLEIDTMPCSLRFHKEHMKYKEMFDYLDHLGYKGHDCSNAGLHIHANRAYLGNTKSKQEFVISKILYIIEKFNNEICVIARKDNSYSKFIGDFDDSVIGLYKKYDREDKKVALNLKHKDTIEFRMFRSTLKYETFLLTLEFVKDIIDCAKDINIEEIETIKWEDITKYFSKDLLDYYYCRLYKDKKGSEIESLKQKLKELNTEYIDTNKNISKSSSKYLICKSYKDKLEKINQEILQCKARLKNITKRRDDIGTNRRT